MPSNTDFSPTCITVYLGVLFSLNEKLLKGVQVKKKKKTWPLASDAILVASEMPINQWLV